MKLRFIKECRLLQILSCTEIELAQLNIICTISWVSFQGKKKKKNTRNYLYNSEYIPGGFWYKILKLKDLGYSVQIENLSRLNTDENGLVLKNLTFDDVAEWSLSLDTSFTPYDYQIKGVWLALKYRISRGEFVTSAGKTFIIYLIIRWLQSFQLQEDQKILIVVPAIMLVNQTAKDFEKYNKSTFPVDTIYGGSSRNRSAQVIIANIDSLVNYDSEFFQNINAVMFDESHKLKTDSYQHVYSMLIQQEIKLIYSCSGTFYDEKTPEDYLASSISGPILTKVGYHQLQELGSISPVKIKMIKFRYNKEISYAYYHHPDSINENKRNHFETKFIQSQIPRFKMIVKIANSIENNQLMLFKTRKYLGVMSEYMKRKHPNKNILVIHGDIESNEREHIKKFTEDNDDVIIFATVQTMSTGVSINKLSTIHLVDSMKSFIMIRQSIGRSLRLHPTKKYATVIDYHDQFVRHNNEWPGRQGTNISVTHAVERRKIYKGQKMPFTKHIIEI